MAEGDQKPVEGEQAKPEQTRSTMIPKERFDEVNEAKNTAEARIAELEAQQPQQPPAQDMFTQQTYQHRFYSVRPPIFTSP